jgi:hypothetical protein
VRVKSVVALLLACMFGVVAVGSAGAKAPKPTKKPKFDVRFACTKVAPATVVTSFAGGWGGTYGLKNQLDNLSTGGGYSDCNYTQSGGFPTTATAEGPGIVTILYGTPALDYYKRDHAAAVEGVRCDKLKASGDANPDPRLCGPVPVAGLGDQAYEANDYVALLRGKVFLQVTLFPIPDAQTGSALPPADLLVSVAKGLLARLPAR